jgi:acetoin:2,6-dichlorophenolindophenol oxidoreductase subunit beta
MTYKQSLIEAMDFIAGQKDTMFIGNGLQNGDRIYGTLNNVPLNRCSEMPVAENLKMGVAIGIALCGFRPVVIFPRMDFMLIAADQIINHLCLWPKMSGGQFNLPVIIRCIVGSQDKKFDVGLQHNKDFSTLFEPYMKVVRLKNGIVEAYKEAYASNEPTMLVEYKDDYNNDAS